jgi:hypothetical protein
MPEAESKRDAGSTLNTDLIYGDATAPAVPEPAPAMTLVFGGLLMTGCRRIRKSYGFLA